MPNEAPRKTPDRMPDDRDDDEAPETPPTEPPPQPIEDPPPPVQPPYVVKSRAITRISANPSRSTAACTGSGHVWRAIGACSPCRSWGHYGKLMG
jgi:hypothetical protein